MCTSPVLTGAIDQERGIRLPLDPHLNVRTNMKANFRQLIPLVVILAFTLAARPLGAMVYTGSDVVSVSDLKDKGVSVAVDGDLTTDKPATVSVTYKDGPKSDTFVAMGFAVYDSPIDEAFCKDLGKRSAKAVRNQETKEHTMKFAVSKRELKDGFLRIEFQLPDANLGPRSHAYYFLLSALDGSASGDCPYCDPTPGGK